MRGEVGPPTFAGLQHRPADGTSIGLVVVDFLVNLKRVLPFETLAAYEAGVGPHLRVFGEVVTQVGLLREAVATHLAHKRLVTGVYFLMNQEMILPLEGLVAVGAHKGAVAVATRWVPEPVQVAGLPSALQQMRGEPALASNSTVATSAAPRAAPPPLSLLT